MRVRWGRVIALGVFAGLLVVAARGCVYARRGGSDTEAPVVSVYDHRADQMLSLDLETYLAGVVAAEMPVSFSLEALKAQAVAARTYTIYHMLHGGCRASGADVCTDSSCCQAYRSDERLKESWSDDYRKNKEKIQRAVDETAGEVLLYEGEPIDALYHSASGGHTEDVEDVYAEALAYLRGVPSTAETGTARLAGEKSFGRAEFAALVNGKWPEAKLDADNLAGEIEITAYTGGGRVKSVRLGKTTVTGRALRALLSLDSTLFSFTVARDNVVFYTKGYGHGVGMSQTGANAMALGGRGYREILAYYYTDVRFATIELTR